MCVKTNSSVAIFGAGAQHLRACGNIAKHIIRIMSIFFIRVQCQRARARQRQSMRDTIRSEKEIGPISKTLMKMNTKHLHNFYLFASRISVPLKTPHIRRSNVVCIVFVIDEMRYFFHHSKLLLHVYTYKSVFFVSCCHCPCPENMQNIEFTQATTLN